MSLEARFSEVPEQPPKCETCLWYDQLDDKDKAFFDEKSTGNKTKLWKACSANGLKVSISAFRGHINEHCGTF